MKDIDQSLQCPLKMDIEQPPQAEEPKAPQYSEYVFLAINALSVVTNGISHFDFKFMKKFIKDDYEEYSFTIWRYVFVLIFNSFKMRYMKEELTPFHKLKGNIWFWVRTIDQFIAIQTLLVLIKYFRVSTATCFISMSPIAIVIMSCLLLNEKFYIRYIYGIFICFGGVMMIVRNEEKIAPGAEEPMTLWRMLCGIFWGIFQLLSVALHRVSSKALLKENFDMNTQIMYPSIVCIILSLIFLPLEGKSFHYSFGLIFHSGINCIIWLCSTYLMLISYKGLDLVKTTAIGYLNIIAVFVLGILFLGETIYFTDIVGSLLILGYNVYNTVSPPHD